MQYVLNTEIERDAGKFESSSEVTQFENLFRQFNAVSCEPTVMSGPKRGRISQSINCKVLSI